MALPASACMTVIRPGAASTISPGRVIRRALRSSPDTVIELAIVGATTAPPATFGAPVSYGEAGAGAGAGVVARAVAFFGARPRGRGGGFRLPDTVMVGSCALPEGRDCAFGAVAAGVWPAGCDCGGKSCGGKPCGGKFCANTPAQRDDSRKDADASKRARNDTKTPCTQGGHNPTTPLRDTHRRGPREFGDAQVHSPAAGMPQRHPAPAVTVAMPSMTMSIKVHTEDGNFDSVRYRLQDRSGPRHPPDCRA